MLSVIIPAYNEVETIGKNIKILKKYLNKLNTNYEIIIAEDGSTDGTDNIVKQIAKTDKSVRTIHRKQKIGRGLALKEAFSIASGNILCYIDADLSPHPKHLGELIRYAKKNDVVTGSRYVKANAVKRPFSRLVASQVYNWLLRVIFSCPIYDFQCGLKAFSRNFFEKEIKYIEEKSWAWDTVVLIEAVKKGYRVKEFPVDWSEKRESPKSSSFKRLISDGIIHGRVLLKLFLKWNMNVKIKL